MTMDNYFEGISKEISGALDIVNNVRKKGFDPEDHVEILLAANMAERVVGLISSVVPQIKNAGIEKRMEELEKEHGFQDWRVAFIIALEVAQEKFCKFKDKKEAAEVGLRVGLGYVTNGVVASPLEGFTRLEIKKTKKDKDYFSLYFSGPIRSAGTTAVCVFVALADYVRKSLGYEKYDPTDDEVKRMSTELYDFHERVTNLQYLPSEKEIEYMTKHLPVQICGEATEKYEVSNYKDLARLESNIISGGVCLVMGEGLTQKAAKFWTKFSGWNKEFKMNHWSFMEKFVKLQKKIRAKGEVKTDDKIVPDYTFIKELVAGRPVFTHPLAKGGFRLRYGRCRNSGFSAQAISPITMLILDDFIATGTQLKVERPGKATVIAACDSIEGPVVKLKNGDVLFLEDKTEAEKYLKEIEEILYLGDILINYGDFFNRGHVLVPAGYCEEWWMLEAGVDERKINVDEAIKLCKEKKVPLHPRYVFHWGDINKKQFSSLVKWLKEGQITEKKVVVPFAYDINLQVSKEDPKRVLELLGVPHRVVAKENVIIEGEWAKALLFSLGGTSVFGFNVNKYENVLEAVNKLSGAIIRDKSGTFIGARMGRPEKAKMRKMTGSPQVLFPVGKEGGRMRCFQSALDKGKIKAQFPLFFCKKCNKETIYGVCEDCGEKTDKKYYCSECGILDKVCGKKDHKCVGYKNTSLDIKHYFDKALEILKIKHYPELIKGVRGTSNEDHTPEHLVKGILRAMHGLYVNRDGTIRYDMTEMPITHFKPIEIKTSVEKLKKLGYEKDIHGEELHNPSQILELKPQDIILPACPETLDERADDLLFKVTNFLDDLLVKLYKTKKYYNLNEKSDLVGHLVIAMSPHTSAGIIGRIIGFSKTQSLLAHPNFHSIMRRDCDGDEAGIMLLMDALLNFSRKYLPAHRGAKQDEPLVLTSKLIPTEVDDMVFDMDIVWKYPLELYEAALEYKFPWDVKIKKYGDVLRTPGEYEGLGYTHETGSVNKGTRCSAYKSIPTMQGKVEGQMNIAEKIRAVDEMDVARLVIERHFVRDIKGNLRKFSMQQFRCVACNEKYRRPPLKGICLKCGGKLIFTIAQGSVVKYLEPSMSLARKYKLPAYLQQTLMLTKQRIESVFGKEKEKQEGLGRWFG